MDQNEYLKQLLNDLETAANQGKDVNTLISENKAKLLSNDSEKGSEASQQTEIPIQQPQPIPIQITKPATEEPTQQQHKKSFWENWYQENNILALLYLGTLLILLSAVTFVAFNWTEISGLTKVFGLSFVTAAFLAGGLYMYFNMQNLKIGGTTFATIGALLIPFNGIALYNFVLKSQEGVIWLTTSAISLAFFYAFTKIFEKNHFKYLAALTTLSFAESFIKVGNFDTKYYILGAIISAFILLLLGRQSQEKDLKSPYSYSANIILPIALLFGLFRALVENAFFEPQVYLAILAAAVFYTLIYYLYKNYSVVSAFVALYTLFIINFTYAVFEIDTVAVYSAFLILSCFAGLSVYYKKPALIEAVTIVSIPLYLLSSAIRETYGSELQVLDSFWFALIIVAFGIIGYKNNKSAIFLYISEISYLIAANLLCFEILETLTATQSKGLFVLLAMLLTAVNYLTYLTKQNFIQLTYLSSGVAMLASMPNEKFVILTSLALAVLYLHHSINEKKSQIAYISGGLLYIALWFGFNELKVEEKFIPIYFALFTGCLFAVEWGTAGEYKAYVKSLVNTGLLATGLLFIGAKQTSSYDLSRCESASSRYRTFSRCTTSVQSAHIAIIGAYLYSVLLSVISKHRNNRTFKYFASIAILVTYFWQLDIFRVKEMLYYNIPLGIYLLGVGYVEKRRQNNTYELFEYGGLVVLFFGLFGNIGGVENIKYALVMALEGFALLAYGIHILNKRFTYAGIGFVVIAVLAQMYEYLASLPRWVVTSVAGLIVLGLAIWLSSKRKTD